MCKQNAWVSDLYRQQLSLETEFVSPWRKYALFPCKKLINRQVVLFLEVKELVLHSPVLLNGEGRMSVLGILAIIW